VQPPHEDPADDENDPAPVEKLTTDIRRSTLRP
jgi:hypothetical protein